VSSEVQRPTISPEEFERAYAERGGVTVEWLREQGRIVATCDCGEDECEGWQSTTREHLADYQAMGRDWVQVLP